MMRSKTCLKPRQCERARLAGFVTLLVVILAATGCTPATGPTREGTGIAVAAPDARLPGTLDRGGIAVPARGKFILVNIPAFELVALEDGRTALRSRVIVGRAAAPTPELLSSMYAVKFNPSWTPTPAMVREEGARPMPPGPNNPLGRLLFELDNDELIYLHDTNDRALFGRPERALSHGCVRVEQARALAAWALGVSEAEVAAMIAKGATQSVPLTAPIPVLLAHPKEASSF